MNAADKQQILPEGAAPSPPQPTAEARPPLRTPGTSRLRFSMTLHAHQPVGNLSDVMEGVYERCYLPFLDILERYEAIRLGWHISGPLLDWLAQTHPDYIERVAALVRSGRVEPVGGGLGEPILPMISDQDRRGQIVAMSAVVRRRLGVRPKGIWVAERVWAPDLPRSLAEAGVEYTFLDDHQFFAVGLPESLLGRPVITEHDGCTVRLLPIPEALRYRIPFAPPADTLEVLRRAAERGDRLAVYADDLEKFGEWPETHKWVYEQGWLEDFFTTLTKQEEFRLCTPSEAMEGVEASGPWYLSDGSYREMTEWALPLVARRKQEDLRVRLQAAGLLETASPQMRGGVWRQFLSRYSEIRRLHARMRRVSERVAQADHGRGASRKARVALYLGQCNCPYWHGVFGGAYLPHLRRGVSSALIRAEALVAPGNGLKTEAADWDLDGVPEMHMANPQLSVCIVPATGGHVAELDLHDPPIHICDVMSRHEEEYHVRVASAKVVRAGESSKTIHGQERAREPGLADRIFYDERPRRSLADHFFRDRPTREHLLRGLAGRIGGFLDGAWEGHIQRTRKEARAILSRTAALATSRLEIVKTVVLPARTPSFRAGHVLRNLGPDPIDLWWGTEFHFSPPTARFAGWTTSPNPPAPTATLEIRDDRIGSWRLSTDPPAEALSYDVETITNSEGGYEAVLQGKAWVFLRPLRLAPGEETSVTWAFGPA